MAGREAEIKVPAPYMMRATHEAVIVPRRLRGRLVWRVYRHVRPFIRQFETEAEAREFAMSRLFNPRGSYV